MTTANPSTGADSLLGLVAEGKFPELEERWMTAVEGGNIEPGECRKVADRLIAAGKTDMAAALVGVLLGNAGEPDPDVLALALDMCILFPRDGSIRQSTIALHEKAGEPGIDRFLKILGTANQANLDDVRAKVRGLLRMRTGCYVNGTERVGPEHVKEYRAADGVFVLDDGQSERELTFEQARDELTALPVDDFRALLRFDVERLKKLAASDPSGMVRSALRSSKNRLEFQDLKKLLARGVVSQGAFTRWWNKAKGLVERDPMIQVYGDRQPTLILRTQPITHEEELALKLQRAENASEKLVCVLEYFTALDQGHDSDERFLHRCAELLVEIAHDAEVENPTAVAAAALSYELANRSADNPNLNPTTVDPEAVRLRFKLLSDLPGTLNHEELARRALLFVRQHAGEEWPKAYADAIPTAPGRLAESLARELVAEGHHELLGHAISTILGAPDRCAEGLLWLWKASASGFFDDLSVKPDPLAVTMGLLRLMDRWARSARSSLSNDQREQLARMRNAVGANNFRNMDRVLNSLSSDQAVALHHEIKANEGVTEVARNHIGYLLVAEHKDAILGRKELWEEDVIYVTRKGLTRRRAEFDQIVNVEMVKNSEAIGTAAGFGDLSENAEFTAALEQRDFLSRRANEISAEINKARILAREQITPDRVNVGTRVSVVPSVGEGAEQTFTFLGPWDTDLDQGIYSYLAPFAMAFLGKRIGDEIEARMDGAPRYYRVVRVEISEQIE